MLYLKQKAVKSFKMKLKMLNATLGEDRVACQNKIYVIGSNSEHFAKSHGSYRPLIWQHLLTRVEKTLPSFPPADFGDRFSPNRQEEGRKEVFFLLPYRQIRALGSLSLFFLSQFETDHNPPPYAYGRAPKHLFVLSVNS